MRHLGISLTFMALIISVGCTRDATLGNDKYLYEIRVTSSSIDISVDNENIVSGTALRDGGKSIFVTADNIRCKLKVNNARNCLVELYQLKYLPSHSVIHENRNLMASYTVYRSGESNNYNFTLLINNSMPEVIWDDRQK